MAEGQLRLGRRTERIFKDMAERIIPSGGPEYPGAGDVALTEIMERQLAGVPFARTGLSAVIWLWEISPFFFSLKFKRFSSLSAKDQTLYLEKWENSGMMWRRFALMGLKGIFMAFFYSDPRVCEKIGYKEDCLRSMSEGREAKESEVAS